MSANLQRKILTRNRSKDTNNPKKQQKLNPEMDSQNKNTVSAEVSASNSKKPSNYNDNTVPPSPTPLNPTSLPKLPLTPFVTPLDTAHKSNSTSPWAEQIDNVDKENAMLVDNTNASASDENFQKNITAAGGADASSSTVKGKNKATEEPIETDDDGAFEKIFKATKYIANIMLDDIQGNSALEKRRNIDAMMISCPEFLGTKINNRTRSIDIFFRSEYAVDQIISKPPPSLAGKTIKNVNSKANRTQEIDRTLVVSDIPLYVKSDIIKDFFAAKATLSRFSMITTGAWQKAFVVFEDKQHVQEFYETSWSISIMDFNVRVEPIDLPDEFRDLRKAFCLKLTGLPPNTSGPDLIDITTQSKAKTCFIPRDKTSSYRPLRYAYLQFESQEALDFAKNSHYKLNNNKLYWVEDNKSKCCFKCGSPDHVNNKCPVVSKPRNQFKPLYDRFMPARYHPCPTLNKNNPQANYSAYNSNNRPPHRSQQNQIDHEQQSYANVVRNPQIRGRDQSQKLGTNASIHKPVVMTAHMLFLHNNRFENLHNMIEKLTNTVTQMSKSVEDLNERVVNLEFKIETIERGPDDYARDHPYNEDLRDEEADRPPRYET